MPHKHCGGTLRPALLLCRLLLLHLGSLLRLLLCVRRTAGRVSTAATTGLAAKHALPQGNHISGQGGSRKVGPIQRLCLAVRTEVGRHHSAPAWTRRVAK